MLIIAAINIYKILQILRCEKLFKEAKLRAIIHLICPEDST